jgi:hypothetical protein
LADLRRAQEIWGCQQCRWRATNLGLGLLRMKGFSSCHACSDSGIGFWEGRDFHRATHALTRGSGFEKEGIFIVSIMLWLGFWEGEISSWHACCDSGLGFDPCEVISVEYSSTLLTSTWCITSCCCCCCCCCCC